MATYDLAASHTLVDVAKLHNNKDQLVASQNMHKKNGIIRVLTWEEANQLTSHVYSKEVALPTGTWRSVNEGVTPEKPQFDQGTEPLSRIEGHSDVDEYIIDDIVPDPKQYRYQYDLRHMEGYLQSIVSELLYGNPGTNPNKPKGLQPRFNALALDNVHGGGCSDAGATTSIYIVQFGPGKVNALYGRGRGAEIIRKEDMGKQFVVTNTSTGAGLYKYRTKWSSVMGLVVYDDRSVQRICNLGVDGADELDIEMFIWAMDCLADPEDIGGTAVICNRLGKNMIEKAFRNRPNMIFTTPDEYGKPMQTVNGARIVLTEGVKNTETVVA